MVGQLGPAVGSLRRRCLTSRSWTGVVFDTQGIVTKVAGLYRRLEDHQGSRPLHGNRETKLGVTPAVFPGSHAPLVDSRGALTLGLGLPRCSSAKVRIPGVKCLSHYRRLRLSSEYSSSSAYRRRISQRRRRGLGEQKKRCGRTEGEA